MSRIYRGNVTFWFLTPDEVEPDQASAGLTMLAQSLASASMMVGQALVPEPVSSVDEVTVEDFHTMAEGQGIDTRAMLARIEAGSNVEQLLDDAAHGHFSSSEDATV